MSTRLYGQGEEIETGSLLRALGVPAQPAGLVHSTHMETLNYLELQLQGTNAFLANMDTKHTTGLMYTCSKHS